MTLQDTVQRNWLKLRRTMTLAGVAAIMLAVMLDVVGLSGPGLSGSQLLLLLAGIMFALVGWLGRRTVDLYRGSAFIVLNTVILIFGLEVGIRVVDSVSSRFSPQQTASIDPRANLPYYLKQDWAISFWTEWTQFNNVAGAYRYYPYAVWRGGPFQGETININQDGIRLTPAVQCEGDAYRVFVFGGSTLWGLGAPDWLTIPAILQSKLDQRLSQPVCVINYGQSAYISSQEIITLLMELQRGNIPDTVIFYDGMNEVGIANAVGRAGTHFYYSSIADRFNQSPGATNTYIPLLSDSRLYQTLQSFAPSLQSPAQDTSPMVDRDQLAEDIIEIYLSNYQIVRAWAEEFGFEYHFFWQPVMFVSEKPFTPEEEPMWEEGSGPILADLYVQVYQQIREEATSREHLYYIADVLDDQTDQIFIDYNHLTPVGNQLVAEEMLRLMGYEPVQSVADT